MSERFLAEMLTEEALAAQERAYGRRMVAPRPGEADRLGEDERAFVETRDSFYLATTTSRGWPYVQHRGGPPGFLAALDERTLAFADLRGNRQLVSTGNLAHDGRVALLLMDYPARARLKILGHATVLDAREHPALADRTSPKGLRSRVERVVRIGIVALSWNCPAYITPRFTEAEIAQAAAPLHARIAELEARVAELVAQSPVG